MLQPMHSRISSSRPSSILRGRNGSAIEGRAAPIRSQTPRADDLGHRSGLVRRPTPTIGFAGGLAHAAGPLELPALGEEARRRPSPATTPRSSRRSRPTGRRGGRRAARTRGPRRSRCPGAAPRRRRSAHGDRAVVADGVLDRLQRLEPEPRAVRERAAVLVGAPVVVRRQELAEQVGVRAVDVDDVEAGVARRGCAASTQSACTRRMSAFVIALGTTPIRSRSAIWEGRAGAGATRCSRRARRCGSARSRPARRARGPARPSSASSAHVLVVPDPGARRRASRRSRGVTVRTRCRQRPSRPRP